MLAKFTFSAAKTFSPAKLDRDSLSVTIYAGSETEAQRRLEFMGFVRHELKEIEYVRSRKPPVRYIALERIGMIMVGMSILAFAVSLGGLIAMLFGEPEGVAFLLYGMVTGIFTAGIGLTMNAVGGIAKHVTAE